MPTKTATTKTQTPRAAKAKETPAAVIPTAPEKFSGFAQKWRESVDRRLTGELKEFVEDALPDEKSFMLEVLTSWQSRKGSDRQAFNEHELPFLSAISEELNGEYLVPVDSDEMVREVEEFITAKLAAGWKPPKRDYSTDQIDTRVRRLLLRHVDYFSHNCRREDMIFLSDILEQWEAIVEDEALKKGTKHHMAAAAEIQLEVLRRQEREERARLARLP